MYYDTRGVGASTATLALAVVDFGWSYWSLVCYITHPATYSCLNEICRVQLTHALVLDTC